MYPEEKNKESAVEMIKPLKEVLGFDEGYVTICKGDTYQHLDWFKESDFRFSRYFGWYLCSTYELPADLPTDLTPVQLRWEEVAVPDGTALKTETAIKEAVEALMFDPSPSQFVGAIGERINARLTVIKAAPVESYYGRSTFHVFEDENQNVYIWSTSAKSLTEGETYTIRGTLKDHQIYKNCKQNVLTRCAVVQE